MATVDGLEQSPSVIDQEIPHNRQQHGGQESFHRTGSLLQTPGSRQAKGMLLILSTKTRAAFDLSLESPEVHDRCGRFRMGQAGVYHSAIVARSGRTAPTDLSALSRDDTRFCISSAVNRSGQSPRITTFRACAADRLRS